jgi:hypothetical protein
MVTTIEYSVHAKDDKYSFRLHLVDDNSEKQWEVVDMKGVPPPALRSAKGDDWRWFPNDASPKTGTLMLFAAGTAVNPSIFLDKVPDDYLHGFFCRIGEGLGIVSVSLREKYEVVWTVWGPGCT